MRPAKRRVFVRQLILHMVQLIRRICLCLIFKPAARAIFQNRRPRQVHSGQPLWRRKGGAATLTRNGVTQHSRSSSFLLFTENEAPQDSRCSRQENIEARSFVRKGFFASLLYTITFKSFALISVSCLHFGQNNGKLSGAVSGRSFIRVLLLQTGHSSHSLLCNSSSVFFMLSLLTL